MSFLTQLDRASYPVVVSLIQSHVLGAESQGRGAGKLKLKSSLDPIPAPTKQKAVQVVGYWVPQGDLEPIASDNVSHMFCYTLKFCVDNFPTVGRFPFQVIKIIINGYN